MTIHLDMILRVLAAGDFGAFLFVAFSDRWLAEHASDAG